MKPHPLLLSTLLLGGLVAGCTDEPDVVVPDARVFASVYGGADRQVVSAPFNIDLSTCGTARLAVPGDAGDQFALTHMSEDGHCQVWLGYDEVSPVEQLHADYYCELEPTSTANVELGYPASSGGGGCGGPPGDPILLIQNARCVPITQ